MRQECTPDSQPQVGPRSCITLFVFGLDSPVPGEYQKIAPTPRKHEILEQLGVPVSLWTVCAQSGRASALPQFGMSNFGKLYW